MEQQQSYEDRLSIARRLHHALCAQFPDRLVVLFDPRSSKISVRSELPVAQQQKRDPDFPVDGASLLS